MDSVITQEDNPVFGFTQPCNGANSKLKLPGMGRPRKPTKDNDPDQTVMRRNIQQRLAVMFPKASGTTEQYKKLNALSGVGEETIRNMMNGNSSPTLKNITSIASAVGLSLPELFTPAEVAANAEDSQRPDQAGDLLHRR